MNRLKRWQWEQLDAQLAATPDPATAPPGPGGQHWILTALLNEFGYHPVDRYDAYRLATKLCEDWSYA